MPTTTPLYRFISYQVVPASPQLEKDVLYMATSLEALVARPITDIVQVAKTNGVLPLSVDHFQDIPSRGLGGLIQLPNEPAPRAVLMGTRDYLTQCRLTIPELLEATTHAWENEENVLVSYIGWDGSVRGALKFKSIL